MAIIEEQDNLGGLPILKKDTQETEIGGLPVLKKKSSQYISSPISSQLASQEANLPDFEKGQKIADIGFAIPQNEIGRAVEKDKKIEGSTAAGLYNTLVGSISSLGGGFAYMSDVLGAPAGLPLNVRVANAEADRAKVADFIQKARSSASSPEFERQQGQFDITNGVDLQDIKGLGFQAPKTLLDMGIGALTGSGSYFVQAINDGQKELDESGNADKLSPTQKVGYLFTQGAVQAALEKVGLDRVLGHTGITKKVGQKLAAEVVDEFVQKGVKATAKDIENAVLSKATKLVSKIKNVGLNAATSALVEGSTEGIQQGASDAIKTITNKIAGNDIFDQEDINSNFLKNIVNNAFAGGVMGGVVSGGISAYNNTNKAIRSQIAAVQSPEDLANLQAQIGEQVEKGNITPQEAEEANIKAEDYAKIAAKIPAQVSTEDKYKIIGGIDQRNQLEAAMQNATNDLDNLDESFKGQKQDEIALIQSKLNQVNDYINGIVGGKEFEYKENEGNFYKIDSEGKETTINKQDYEIAKAVEDENKRKQQIQEAKLTEEEQLKTKENAIQELSTGEILQRPQEGVGEAGGERPRVEPSIQGVEIAKEGEQAKINEEKGLSSKGLKAAETRRINQEANKIEATDSRSAALKYLSGANLSQDAINEIAGRVKRAELNTGRREFKTQEVKLRDYVAKKGEGESLDEAVHNIWQDISKKNPNITTEEVKNDLMQAVLEHTTKSEAAKALIEGYKETDIEELERKHYEKYGDNSEIEADNQFNDAPQEDLDIDKELINANYETEQQFQDAYWDAHQATYIAPEKTTSTETKKTAVAKKEPIKNEFLYTGTDAERQKGLLKNLMESDIPNDYKKGLEEKGLTYKVSNQVEASESAKAIINSLGITDALEIARSEKIDPSVGSAIYSESLNNLWSNERRLKADGKIEEANALGKQWSDITLEYANKLNSKGKWTAQVAYFYKTSPLGFAIRIENERVEQFQTWYESKEKDYKKVFTEILKSEEGQALLKEEVEKISKEERAKLRADKRQKIDEFFENAKLKGNNLYAIPIPPQLINGALEVMKKAVLAGESVTNAVSMAVEHISKEVKDWDKEKFKKEYESKLSKITEEKSDADLLASRIKSLEKQIEDYKKKISEGGAIKPKVSEKFADNEEVNNLKKEREALQKENQNLLKQKKEGRYSDEAKLAQSEKRILKSIEDLEKKIEDNDLEIEKPEKLTTPELDQLKEKQKKLREELNNKRKEAGIGRFSEEAKYEAKVKRNKDRIAELNRRMEQGDFSSETYKAKKEKDVLDKELERVKEKYDEAKKKSPEYIDKKAKQYLDKLRKRLRGIDESKKEEIRRM